MSCGDYKHNQEQLLFNEQRNITADTFPSFTALQDILFREDMNQFLNMIKNRIIQAKRGNIPFVRILQAEQGIYSQHVINETKSFLAVRGYVITELEDVAGVSIGWKINYM